MKAGETLWRRMFGSSPPFYIRSIAAKPNRLRPPFGKIRKEPSPTKADADAASHGDDVVKEDGKRSITFSRL